MKQKQFNLGALGSGQAGVGHEDYDLPAVHVGQQDRVAFGARHRLEVEGKPAAGRDPRGGGDPRCERLRSGAAAFMSGFVPICQGLFQKPATVGCLQAMRSGVPGSAAQPAGPAWCRRSLESSCCELATAPLPTPSVAMPCLCPLLRMVRRCSTRRCDRREENFVPALDGTGAPLKIMGERALAQIDATVRSSSGKITVCGPRLHFGTPAAVATR